MTNYWSFRALILTFCSSCFKSRSQIHLLSSISKLSVYIPCSKSVVLTPTGRVAPKLKAIEKSVRELILVLFAETFESFQIFHLHARCCFYSVLFNKRCSLIWQNQQLKYLGLFVRKTLPIFHQLILKICGSFYETFLSQPLSECPIYLWPKWEKNVFIYLSLKGLSSNGKTRWTSLVLEMDFKSREF